MSFNTENIRLLLVDDEDGFRQALAKRMKKRGFHPEQAGDGEACLTFLEKHPADIVVLDVKMPGFDGIETLRRIRKKWPLIEVVMLTAHSTLDSAINAVKIGAYDYLLKPIEMEQLVSKIKKAACRKRNRDKLILEVYMKPYLTRREQDEQIAKILEPETKNSGV